MQDKTFRLVHCLENGFTPYHVAENIKAQLLENGYAPLWEEQSWALEKGGKYFLQREGSIIAFCVNNADELSFKIAASHTDACALKLKEKFLVKANGYTKLNVETYGSGIWYSFFDKPLKIAGRVCYQQGDIITQKIVQSPYNVQIPSVAIHCNREVNDKFAIQPQTDLLPVLCTGEDMDETQFFQSLGVNERVLGYDLFLVSAEKAYEVGTQNQMLASPRIDNLTSVQASLEALLSHQTDSGICVAAFFNHEEVGSHTTQGAAGDFLENTLRRITYVLQGSETDFYKAMASSFLLSIDNAHAIHPNHPEYSDITNKTQLGKGIVIKSHAKQCYATTGLTSAVLKTIFEKANVPYQTFFNNSNLRSGSTLGNIAITRFGIHAADIGIAQLAMHSATECFAKADYFTLIDGVTAFYSTSLTQNETNFIVR